MKITYITLKNYIGIFNGTGRREINFNFSFNKNPIIVIEGANGSGKSTLLNALHPFPDAFSALIPGENAQKRIGYICNGNTYDICIDYPVKSNGERATSIVHISKNGTECNPSGNVTSASQFIMNEFELDPNLLALSQLSSEDKGLASKRPAERKRIVASRLTDMSAYNAIYKTLTEKSSVLKAMLKSLTYKINDLGGNNMNYLQSQLELQRSTKAKLDAEIEDLNRRIGALEFNKESLNFDENLYNNTIKDIIDLSNTLEEQINTLNTKLFYDNSFDKNIDIKDIDSIDFGSIKAYFEESKNLCESNKSSSEIAIKNQQSKYDEVSKNYEDANNDLSNFRSEMTQYLHIDGITNPDEFLKKFEALKQRRSELINAIENKNILDSSFNIDSLDHYISQFSKLADYAASCGDIPQEGTNQIKFRIKRVSDTMKEIEATLKDIKDEIASIMGISIDTIDLFETIPEECFKKKSPCALVKRCIVYKVNLDKIAKLQEKYANTFKIYKEYEEQRNDLTEYLENAKMADIYGDLIADPIYKTFILNSIPLDDQNKSKLSIFRCMDILKSIRDQYNLKVMLDTVNKEYTDSFDVYTNIMNNKSKIDICQEKINTILLEIANYNKILSDAKNDIEIYKNNIYNYSKKIDNCNKIIDLINSIMLNYEEKNKKIALRDKLMSTYTEYKQNDLEIEKLTKELKDKEILHAEAVNAIANLSHNITTINEYKREYDTYMANVDKIETVRKFASPTTGIQTLFMEIYMNNVLILANQLLSNMFGGRFVLQPFVINETEFKIPCAGNGILNDDVTSMSLSQRSMIGMIINFALLFSSSSVYNIIKLDEIDGGLDTNNRMQFIAVLLRVMELMHCEQCFIISHNSEIDESMTHVIRIQ